MPHMALIQKQAAKQYFAMIRPNGMDIVYSIIITVIVLGVAVMPTIFDKYNTFGAREVLASDAGGAIGRFLLRIDGLSFTNSVVTFMLWGAIGIVIYGLVSAFVRALARVEQSHELASEKYVHPTSFSRASFWREELLMSASGVLTLVVLGVVIMFIVLKLLPVAVIHVRSLITSGGHGIWPAVASIVLLVIVVAVAILSYRLWRHRKILFTRV